MKKNKFQGTFSSLGVYDVVVLEKCEIGSLVSILPNHGSTYYLVLEDEPGSLEDVQKRSPGDFVHLLNAYEFSLYDDAKWAYEQMKESGCLGSVLIAMGYKIRD